MVSILILCRNYEQYLEKAVKSAEAQTYPNCEVLVFHDSCDKPFTQDHPQGEARMRNIAADRAKGEYLLYLDADDYIEPQAVETMFSIAEPNTVITCWTQFFEGSNMLYKAGKGMNKYAPKDFLTENRTTITCLLPKNIWREVGGFDTKCPGYPDWEFWIRVAWKGFKFKTANEILFNYRIHENSEGKKALTKGCAPINYIMRKHKDKYDQL